MLRLTQGLPEAIRMMASGHNDGLKIREMLALWESDILLPTADGKNVAILRVSEVDIFTEIVSIECRGSYYKEVVSPLGNTLMIPVEPAFCPNISQEWLNEKHPGWKERFVIARELGMKPIDALRAMTQCIAVDNSVTLPETIGPA